MTDQTMANMSDSELARKYIQELELLPHPEGGWFKLVHVSDSLYAKKGDRGERGREA